MSARCLKYDLKRKISSGRCKRVMNILCNVVQPGAKPKIQSRYTIIVKLYVRFSFIYIIHRLLPKVFFFFFWKREVSWLSVHKRGG